MIVKLVSPLNIGNAVNLVLRSLSTSQRVSLTSLRCYSIASSQNLYHLRSQKRPVCNSTIEKGIVHCYSTKFTDKPLKDERSQTGTSSLRKSTETEVSMDSNATLWDREGKGSSKSLVDEHWNDVSTGDEDSAHRRAMIEARVEMLRQDGLRVPDVITHAQWEELFRLNSEKSQRKYLHYLFIVEKKKANTLIKKQKRRIELDSSYTPTLFTSLDRLVGEDGHHAYGLWRNSLFIKILGTTIDRYHNNRLLTELMFGQHLILDLGFEEHMTIQERKGLAKQIRESFAYNRKERVPFYLNLCNANRDSLTMQTLHKHIPILYDNDFPMDLHSGSYLDHFPKNELVYLTPDAGEELKTFDPSATYIVGGIVDKGVSEPLTLAKAKRDSIKMKRLPLDRYLSWGSGGSKSLTINQVVAILLDLKHSCDWQTALRHVPRRKLMTEEEIQLRLKKDLLKKLKADRRFGKERPYFKHDRHRRY